MAAYLKDLRFKHLRKNRRGDNVVWTIKQIAKAIGVSERTVKRAETSGKVTPGVFSKLLAFYGVPAKVPEVSGDALQDALIASLTKQIGIDSDEQFIADQKKAVEEIETQSVETSISVDLPSPPMCDEIDDH